MKKEMIVILLLTVLFISMPIVSAQTYSGFSRFVDNVKLFFAGGDAKVQLALEIREKEVNSAIENLQAMNDEGVDKSLKNAWKKLQLIQEKATIKTAQAIKQSSDEVIEYITNTENLTEDFEVYVLEEEKTGLTAEWVIEVNGPEGQTMQNEVIGEPGVQTRIIEIETRINEIDNEISNWVVVNGMGNETVTGSLTVVVKKEVVEGDNGLKPEVKTSVAGGSSGNDVAPGPQGIVGYEEHDSNDNEGATDEVVSGDRGEGDYSEGATAGGGGGGSSSNEESPSSEGSSDTSTDSGSVEE